MQILVGKCKAKDLIKEITRVWLKNTVGVAISTPSKS